MSTPLTAAERLARVDQALAIHAARLDAADEDDARNYHLGWVSGLQCARDELQPVLATLVAAEAETARLRAGLAATREAVYWAHGKAQTVAHYESVAMLERAMARLDALLEGATNAP